MIPSLLPREAASRSESATTAPSADRRSSRTTCECPGPAAQLHRATGAVPRLGSEPASACVTQPPDSRQHRPAYRAGPVTTSDGAASRNPAGATSLSHGGGGQVRAAAAADSEGVEQARAASGPARRTARRRGAAASYSATFSIMRVVKHGRGSGSLVRFHLCNISLSCRPVTA